MGGDLLDDLAAPLNGWEQGEDKWCNKDHLVDVKSEVDIRKE